jgi:hypothetical protein
VRTVSGRITPEGPTAYHTFVQRRFRCTRCRKTFTVRPIDVLPYKHFSALTIALSLGDYGVCRNTQHEICARYNPAKTRGANARGWRTLCRWIAIVSSLFTDVRPAPDAFTPRQIAERAAMTLASRGTSDALTPDTLSSWLAWAVRHPP